MLTMPDLRARELPPVTAAFTSNEFILTTEPPWTPGYFRAEGTKFSNGWHVDLFLVYDLPATRQLDPADAGEYLLNPRGDNPLRLPFAPTPREFIWAFARWAQRESVRHEVDAWNLAEHFGTEPGNEDPKWWIA